MVVVVRCQDADRIFYVRLVPVDEWLEATHAFGQWFEPPDADQSGYGTVTLSGTLVVGQRYSGCSHCGQLGLAKCGSCERLSCWNSTDQTFSCVWCKHSGRISGGITRVSARSEQ